MSKETPASDKPKVTATVRQPQQPSIRAIDVPELAETFADSITATYFDGQTLRVEFGVTRWDPVRPNQPVTGRRYPACRLVLSAAAAADLAARLQQINAALTQSGVLKQGQAGAATPRPDA